MIADTSALIAILSEEDDAALYLDAVESAATTSISSTTFLETGIVLARRYEMERSDELRAFLETANIEIVPFTAKQAYRALQAYGKYGRGFHNAALNFGDCAAYALAMERGEPLLFKGGDFARTDVPSWL